MVDERTGESVEEGLEGRPVAEAEGGKSGEASERQSTAGRHHGKVVSRRARTPPLPPAPTSTTHAKVSPMATGDRRLPQRTCNRVWGALKL